MVVRKGFDKTQQRLMIKAVSTVVEETSRGNNNYIAFRTWNGGRMAAYGEDEGDATRKGKDVRGCPAHRNRAACVPVFHQQNASVRT